jgi:hypothetical protein
MTSIKFEERTKRHTAETAGNRLYDVINLLDSFHGPLGYAEPVITLKVLRVVKHALVGIKDDLCGDCTYGKYFLSESR